MISFILIVENEKDLKYTVDSIKKNYNDNFECIVISSDIGIKTEEDYIIIEKRNGTLGKLINKAIAISKGEKCFCVKAGVYITKEAIKGLIRAIDKEKEVGIFVPMINSFVEKQKYMFTNIYEKQLEKEIRSLSLKNGGLRSYINDIDDNLISFNKDIFNEVGGFSDETDNLLFLYKDYLVKNFIAGYNAKVCLDSLVYTKNICNLKEFNSKKGQAFLKKLKVSFFEKDKVLDSLIDFVKENPYEELKIAEVGAQGINTLLALKDKFVEAEILGFEVGKGKGYVYPPCIRFFEGNIESNLGKLKDKDLDYIICHDLFENISDPIKLIRKIYRKLKDDGTVILEIFNGNHISVIAELLNGVLNYNDEDYTLGKRIRFFTINNIMRILNEEGFDISLISGIQSNNVGENEFIEELFNLNLVNKAMAQPVELKAQYKVMQYQLVCRKREV